MRSFGNAWDLAKSSMRVLRADKELAALPILAFLSTIVVGAVFYGPVIAMGQTTSSDGTSTFTFGPVGWILSFLGLVALNYVRIFFGAAIVHGANQRMQGGDPTLATSLQGAKSRAGAILPWAVISATVSMVLRAIEQRTGLVGRIVIGLIGLAWSLVTFLVLPILVLEQIGVVDAIKKSANLFKRTWGEQVVGNAGIAVIGFVALLAGMPVVMLAAFVGVALFVVAAVLYVLWCAVVLTVVSALSGIYCTALYRFATDGVAPQGFDTATMQAAFRPREGRGLFR